MANGYYELIGLVPALRHLTRRQSGERRIQFRRHLGMCDSEWLAATLPTRLLEFLGGEVSDRRWRLFGCACCRRIWHLLDDERSRRAVEAAEQVADAELEGDSFGPALNDAEAAETAAYEALAIACDAANLSLDFIPYTYDPRTCRQASRYDAACAAASVFRGLGGDLYVHADAATAVASADATANPVRQIGNIWSSLLASRTFEAVRDGEHARQAGLLRDIVGNPFRRVAADPKWRTSDVVALARGIYAERAFDRLPILADALEEAGCDHPDVLTHCHAPGPHVRGCWVVDLALGRS